MSILKDKEVPDGEPVYKWGEIFSALLKTQKDLIIINKTTFHIFFVSGSCMNFDNTIVLDMCYTPYENGYIYSKSKMLGIPTTVVQSDYYSIYMDADKELHILESIIRKYDKDFINYDKSHPNIKTEDINSVRNDIETAIINKKV